jgi:hypothetical protein
MKILLIGLGRFGSAIVKRLLEEEHQLIVIESDINVVENFLNECKDETGNVKICVGDATSLLVWEYLKLNEFDLIISSVRSNEFNKAICEIVREIYKNFDIPILILSFDAKYEHVFSNYNCQTVLIPDVVSLYVESFALKGIRKPIGIGLGKNEILEATVSPRSPYVRIPIYPNRLRHWKIGLVYRNEEIILPRRRFLLRPQDRVIIFGDDPKIVLEVAKSMALGEPQFPLSFGENLLVALKKSELHYLKEYYYLWKHSRIKNVYLFCDVGDKSEISELIEDKDFLKILFLEKFKGYNSIFNKKLQTQLSAGLISAPYKREWLFFHNYNLKKLFSQEVPFLLPKLTFPYRKILVSLNTENPQGMIEPIFEILLLTGAEKLTLLSVELPDVLMPKREAEKIENTLKLAEDYAKLFRVKEKIDTIRRKGNPKRETLKLLKDYDLLIVGFTPQRLGFFEPYTPYVLTKSSFKSVLGVPTEKGTEV